MGAWSEVLKWEEEAPPTITITYGDEDMRNSLTPSRENYPSIELTLRPIAADHCNPEDREWTLQESIRHFADILDFIRDQGVFEIGVTRLNNTFPVNIGEAE